MAKQRVLTELGYAPPDGFNGRGGLDEIYGDRTTKAVKQFEKDHGLPIDGKWDPGVEKAVCIEKCALHGLNTKTGLGSYPKTCGLETWKDRDDALFKAGVDPGGEDGKYDKNTALAICEYQYKNELKYMDGVWGEETNNAICTELGLPLTNKSTLGGTGGGGGTPTGGAPSAGKGTEGYLGNLYAWMLGIVGLSALFAIVAGGVLYIFSGTVSSTAQATKYFKNAALGLLVAALSWIILYTINPELVKTGFDIKSIVEKAR